MFLGSAREDQLGIHSTKWQTVWNYETPLFTRLLAVVQYLKCTPDNEWHMENSALPNQVLFDKRTSFRALSNVEKLHGHRLRMLERTESIYFVVSTTRWRKLARPVKNLMQYCHMISNVQAGILPQRNYTLAWQQ